MLSIELCEYGLKEVLGDIYEDLSSVLGKEHSKKEKDEKILKALGAVNALNELILVWDTDFPEDK